MKFQQIPSGKTNLVIIEPAEKIEDDQLEKIKNILKRKKNITEVKITGNRLEIWKNGLSSWKQIYLGIEIVN